MDRECENNSCDFLVGLGDNFYWDGVKNAEDPRFKFTFENVYGKSSERENICAIAWIVELFSCVLQGLE